jgi:hypothetical protein
MAGKSTMDQLIVDEVVDNIHDIHEEMIKTILFEKDEAKKVKINYSVIFLTFSYRAIYISFNKSFISLIFIFYTCR